MMHFDLRVNGMRIARFEAERVTNADARPKPDDVNTYEVKIDPEPFALPEGSELEPWTGTVQHRYGAGALSLVHGALSRYLIARAGQ